MKYSTRILFTDDVSTAQEMSRRDSIMELKHEGDENIKFDDNQVALRKRASSCSRLSGYATGANRAELDNPRPFKRIKLF